MAAVEKAMIGDQRIFLVTQKDMQTEHAKQEDVYTIGVVAEIKQIVKMPMCNRSCFPVERHKPGCVAPFQRRLRNQFFRQIIVKVMCFQQIQPFPIRRFFPRFTLTGRNEYDMMRPLEFADICPSCKNILFLHKPNVLYYIPK